MLWTSGDSVGYLHYSYGNLGVKPVDFLPFFIDRIRTGIFNIIWIIQYEPKINVQDFEKLL